jgi:flavin reductase (DIM6/NTAB) family NADH-FMN oxidoreductase RutF
MQFDFEKLSATDRYKLIISTVVPRPIAWVTSLDKDGTPNAAPYSFFNAIGNDPPIIMFSVQQNAAKSLKDTSHNILGASEFVVNLVDEALAEAMNVTSIDSPPGVDEMKLAGLAMAPSTKVKPPRIAQSPVSYECRTHSIVSFGPNQAVIFGMIVQAHIADACVLDAQRCHVDTARMKLVGRMHGSSWYVRTGDTFEMQRPVWADWVKQGKV